MNTLSGIKSKIWNFPLYLYFHSVNETLKINFVYFTSETLLLGTSQFINIYVSYPPRGSCSEKLWLSSLNCCSWLQNEGSTFVCGVTDCPVLPDPMVSTNTVCFFFFWQRDQNKHSWKPYHEPKQRWQNPYRINNQSDDRNCYNALLV